MRCKAFSTCHKCNNNILWIDYEEYDATEIIIDKKWVDLCGCCYHDLIKFHVEDCLNDISIYDHSQTKCQWIESTKNTLDNNYEK